MKLAKELLINILIIFVIVVLAFGLLIGAAALFGWLATHAGPVVTMLVISLIVSIIFGSLYTWDHR